jgi:hypothetical protein
LKFKALEPTFYDEYVYGGKFILKHEGETPQPPPPKKKIGRVNQNEI